MKEAIDLVVGREEMLCLLRRFEALRLPFLPLRRLMRVPHAIVEPLGPAVLDAGDQLLLCDAVASELVGDHDARRPALPLQQLAPQA